MQENVPAQPYPWFIEVSDHSLEQGDLLYEFPAIRLLGDYSQLIAGELDIDIEFLNLIIVTQSCDLDSNKTDNVILAPFHTRQEIADKFAPVGRKGGLREIQKGRWQSFYLLPPFSHDGSSLECRIVNFRDTLAVPFRIVEQYVSTKDTRPRLAPPYREHLSQRFGNFFMRIGLPDDFSPPD